MKKNITRRERVDKKVLELEFDAGNSEEYKVEAIWNRIVHTIKAKGDLSNL